MGDIGHAARCQTPQRHAHLKGRNVRACAANDEIEGGRTLNSLVLTMWRLSGHHLLAARLPNAGIRRTNHSTNHATHPAAPSSMQQVHAGSVMHHTCTAARGSMAHRMYLSRSHAACRRDARARAHTHTHTRTHTHAHWLSALHSHDVMASMHTKEATTRRLATARTLSFMSTQEATYLITTSITRCICKKHDIDHMMWDIHAVRRELG